MRILALLTLMMLNINFLISQEFEPDKIFFPEDWIIYKYDDTLYVPVSDSEDSLFNETFEGKFFFPENLIIYSNEYIVQYNKDSLGADSIYVENISLTISEDTLFFNDTLNETLLYYGIKEDSIISFSMYMGKLFLLEEDNSSYWFNWNTFRDDYIDIDTLIAKLDSPEDSLVYLRSEYRLKTYYFDSSSCHPSSSDIVQTSCNSYTSPSGKVWTMTDKYIDTIPNFAGCDSIITIDLTINNSTTSNITEIACDNYTSPSGKIWFVSDIYIDTIPNTAGCDSILTIDLTIDCTNSISSNNILQSSIYPNPANDKVIIDLEELNNRVRVEIFTLTGELIITEEYYNDRQISIDLKIPHDIYFIKVTNEEGNSNLFKILKQ